jgi:hypothetical protein
MKPHLVPPDEKQRAEFLSLIADGKTRQEAAEAVGSTATRFRTFINGAGEESVAFAERYLEALEAAGKAPSPLALRVKEAEGFHLAHRLLDETIMRALDAERGRSGSSNRMLHNLNLLKLEDFRPLLEARIRHTHEGAIGVYAMPAIDTEKWSVEQQREFVELRRRMVELLEVARPDGTDAPRRAALPAGIDVIDQEPVEIDTQVA